MTIAGSDNSGGAGIEADLKTFTTLGVYGTCALTCVVAENPARVKSIQAIQPMIVRDQINLIFEAFPVKAIKTGMLYSQELIEMIVRCLKDQKETKLLVVDPVMIATSGARLLKRDAIHALEEKLIPLATVVTPNLDEASFFLNERISDFNAMREAAFLLQHRWQCAVLLKGGHLKAKEAVDVLVTAKGMKIFRAPYEKKVHTHGTGCTFSAAITAALAKGFSLDDAVQRGKRFVTRAIARRKRIGSFEVLNHLP